MRNKLFTLLLIIIIYTCNANANSDTVHVFVDNQIHFGNKTKFDTEDVFGESSGRVIRRTIQLPNYNVPVKITAHLDIQSTKKSGQDGDPWDRAGNVYLSTTGMENIELLKFCTGFGGHSILSQDVTGISALLNDEVVIKGFVDTWVSPAWIMSFYLVFEETEVINPTWNHGIYFTTGMKRGDVTNEGPSSTVTIPENPEKIELTYYTSGHSINGNRDEFYTKDNVIYVDDVEVYRFRPWRTDCGNFQSVNPYSGYWYENGQKVYSYELSRSGWCPGDKVYPVVLDLSDNLTSGTHNVRFAIENIYQQGDSFGYWRVSSFLSGYGNIDSWIPTKIILTGPEENKIILPDKAVPVQLELTDANDNMIITAQAVIKVNSPDTSASFSLDNEIWSDSILVDVKHGNCLFWTKSSIDGAFRVLAAENANEIGLNASNQLIINVLDLEVDENDENYSLTASAQGDCECNSSTESAYHAIDGDIATKWCCNDGSPNWLTVELAEETELDYFLIRHAGAGEPPAGDPGAGDNSSMNSTNFLIQQKKDDGSWDDIVTITDNPATEDGDVSYHFLDNPIQTNFIRLYINNPDVARIYEFEMYNINKTKINDDDNFAGKFKLDDNYPNPFNSMTNIKFFVPDVAQVNVKIYDSRGRFVKQLLHGNVVRGEHFLRWNAKDNNDRNVSSGIYFLNINYINKQGIRFNKINKMIYLR